MLFPSPVFLFIFLPLTMLSYIAVPRKHKRTALLTYSIIFYIFANSHRPINILLMAAVILIAYVAGELMRRDRNRTVVAIFVSLIIFALFVVRLIGQLLYRSHYDFYPLGASVYMLAAISYIVDVYRKEEAPGSLFDVTLFISFFPVLVCGPFIRYKDFVSMTSPERSTSPSEVNLMPTLSSFSTGILFFSLGFIKKIGISAVFVEIYESLLSIGSAEYSFLLLTIISFFVFLSVFFGFSGYSDMAVGLCYMFGIRVGDNSSNLLRSVTSPRRYLLSFLPSLGVWMSEYIRKPLKAFLRKKIKVGTKRSERCITFISAFTCFLCIGAWFKSDIRILILIIPFATLASVEILLHERKRFRSKFLYIPLTIVNLLILSFFWSLMKDGSFEAFWGSITHSALIGYEEQLYEMVSTLFSTKTLISFIAALVCACIEIGSTRLYIRNAKTTPALLLKLCTSILILFGFFVCVMIYAPQYPIYATLPFKYFAT